MKLGNLTLENILGCPDGSYDLVDERGDPLDVAIVTGGSGSGKTSFLEAVAMLKETIGGYGPAPTARAMLLRGAAQARMAARWVLNEAERRLVGAPSATCTVELHLDRDAIRVVGATADLRPLFERFDAAPGCGKFEYFPANRELHSTAGMIAAEPMPVSVEAPLRLSKPADKYDCVHTTLVRAAQDTSGSVLAELRDKGVVLGAPTNDQLEPFQSALRKMTNRVRLLGVARRRGQLRAVFAHRSGIDLELDDLSASERQAVLFATTFTRLALTDSVVLLDEPERSIHPADQADFLRRIAGLGTNNQLIVATASAAILRAARPNQILTLSTPR